MSNESEGRSSLVGIAVTVRVAATTALMTAHEKQEVLTGVFYIDTTKPSFTELLNLVDEPLATLPEEKTRPGKAVLDEVMQRLM